MLLKLAILSFLSIEVEPNNKQKEFSLLPPPLPIFGCCYSPKDLHAKRFPSMMNFVQHPCGRLNYLAFLFFGILFQ